MKAEGGAAADDLLALGGYSRLGSPWHVVSPITVNVRASRKGILSVVDERQQRPKSAGFVPSKIPAGAAVDQMALAIKERLCRSCLHIATLRDGELTAAVDKALRSLRDQNGRI